MARSNSVTRNAHAKRFIQKVFADRLLAAGFVCPDDKLLCWYRVVNKEIVNSICFYSPFANLPLMVSIGYGIHPLFTLPARIPGVYAPNRPLDRETFRHQELLPNPDIGHCHMTMYHPDAQVYAPEGGSGIYTLEGILLPIMNQVQTVEDCYRMHKQNYLRRTDIPEASRFGDASITFMDEAIFCDDSDLFPCFASALEQRIRFYESECGKHPANKALQSTLLHVKWQKQALFEGKQPEFLDHLQQQKAANMEQLAKKYGLSGTNFL